MNFIKITITQIHIVHNTVRGADLNNGRYRHLFKVHLLTAQYLKSLELFRLQADLIFCYKILHNLVIITQTFP